MAFTYCGDGLWACEPRMKHAIEAKASAGLENVQCKGCKMGDENLLMCDECETTPLTENDMNKTPCEMYLCESCQKLHKNPDWCIACASNV